MLHFPPFPVVQRCFVQMQLRSTSNFKKRLHYFRLFPQMYKGARSFNVASTAKTTKDLSIERRGRWCLVLLGLEGSERLRARPYHMTKKKHRITGFCFSIQATTYCTVMGKMAQRFGSWIFFGASPKAQNRFVYVISRDVGSVSQINEVVVINHSLLTIGYGSSIV